MIVPTAIRARCYVTWNNWLSRARVGFEVLHQGIWLGLVDTRHLNDVGRLQYARWENYADDHYNLSGLLSWEERVVSSYFHDASSILIASAGGGREAIALSRMGNHVDGFDSTPGLLECYRRLKDGEELPGKVLLARPGRVPDGIDMSYDGIIVGWGGYMHIPERTNRVAFLTELRRHVGPDAPLLLSFFCRGEHSRRHDAVCAIARPLRKLRGSKDIVECGDTLTTTFDHYFTEAEVRTEMAESGFELAEYSETPYGHAVGRAI